MRRSSLGIWILGATVLLTAACGSSTSPSGGNDSSTAPTASNNNASFNKDEYPVFPDADAGADPTVSAEQGGKGFKGEGWETNTSYDLIGDPRAVKGGVFRQAMTTTDFPSTLRYYGPNISTWNGWLHSIVYESLLALHPSTLEFIPQLATHWQISSDKLTYRFRLNPNARWSDGMPVVAEDIVASWKLAVDKSLQDPARAVTFSKFDQPVAESKYIVSVKTRTGGWREFMDFAVNLFVYPSHSLKDVTGASYIKDFNYKMLPGTGPYKIADADVEKGKSIKVRRRMDYWAENHRRNAGLNNFDILDEVTVRDRSLEFEMFKKGELDVYFPNRASMWVNELDYPNIKRGLNQKRKIFNQNPNGIQGYAMNVRREPLNDTRVRKALAHLFNREQMVEKLMFNQYELMHSIFPGSTYENPNNFRMKYDPETAVKLLAEAGWRDRNSKGRLVKDGKPMEFELIYFDQAQEKYGTNFQEALGKVGISLNLRFVTFETMLKLVDERTFDIVSVAYSGSTFPDPESNWHSKMADEKNTNNLTGFKNKRADEIFTAYNAEYDLAKRIKLLQEFDAVFTSEQHWILEWTAPYQRVLYWNKFGQPQGIISNIGDAHDVPAMWWIDPDKAQKLEQARKDSSINLGEGASDDRYWLEVAKAREQKTGKP